MDKTTDNNFKYSKIIGLGAYAPEKILTNFDLEKIVDTSNDWIIKRTGIQERRIVNDEQATSDIAKEAALIALERANVKPEDIDIIIFGTASPDYMFPSTGCILQKKIGAVNAAAFDIMAGCSSFLYALNIADSMIKAGAAKTILAIGAEVLSKFINWDDRTTCVIFGDGAGAAVLVEADKPGIHQIKIKSDGRYENLLKMPAGGTKQPASLKTVEKKLHTIHMKGNEVFKIAVNSLKDIATEILQKSGFESQDIDLFVPHQANIRIINSVAEKLKLKKEQVYINVHKYGNTSSASIPLALNDAINDGKLKSGTKVLMTAFGAGLTWAGALVEF